MKYILLASLLVLSACGHKADLKTPSQIAAEQKKKESKAAKDAARKAKQENNSQEVTVP